MAELDEKGERGLALIGAMMAPGFSERLRAAATSGKFGSAISRLAVDYASADVWGREGLEKKLKSLVVIGILIAQRQAAELKNHVKVGIANGLTVQEIEEALIQAAPYVGFPSIATAGTAVVEALREVGLDPDVPTAEERGLL